MEYFNKLAKPFHFEGSKDKGVYLIHGFTGSPGKLRLLGEHIHSETGYTVSAVLLRGHGTSVEDMVKYRAEDWMDDALNGFDRLREKCEKVFVIGFSMGALLALKVAQERPVDRLVTIEAAMVDRNPFARFAFIAKYFMPYVEWDEMDPEIEKDYEMEYNVGYEGMHTESVVQLLKVRKTVKKRLGDVTCPTLIIHSVEDEAVKPEGSKLIHKKISSEDKRLLLLQKSTHLAPFGPEREIIFREITEFITE